jgi:predicted phage replisome organizer
MAEKKYYWMRLKPTFFTSKEIKKLRKIAGGDTYIIIYLKMQLLSLETGGKLYYDGIEDDFADEIALELDEDADNVRMTLAYLEKCGLIEQRTDDEYYLPEVSENTGSETAAAMRMRKSRNRNNVTIERNNVTPMLHNRYTEKEIEKEIEIEKDNIYADSESALVSEFEQIWKTYPRKEGKTNALKAYIKARTDKKDPVSMEDVQSGLQAYIEYIKAEGTPTQYIKHGSTWFNQRCWNDEYTSSKATQEEYHTPTEADYDFSDWYK